MLNCLFGFIIILLPLGRVKFASCNTEHEPSSTGQLRYINPYHHLPSLSIILRTYYADIDIYKTYFLPSYLLFWPNEYYQSEVVLVLDEESDEDKKVGLDLLSHPGNPPYPRIVFENHPGPGVLRSDAHRGEGYARQIWSSFYMDLQSSKEFVGLADTDTSFITPIIPEQLFHVDANQQRKPVIYCYNDPWSTGWCPDIVMVALGNKRCIGEFMVVIGFPLIVKRQHLRKLRDVITRNLNASHFNEAFSIMYNNSFFSQQDVIGNYLYHYHRDSYKWHIRESRGGNNHPALSGGNINDKDAELNKKYNIPIVGRMQHDVNNCCHWEALSCAATEWRAPGCEPSKFNQSEKVKIQSWADMQLSRDWYCPPSQPDCNNERPWSTSTVSWNSTLFDYRKRVRAIMRSSLDRGVTQFGAQRGVAALGVPTFTPIQLN